MAAGESTLPPPVPSPALVHAGFWLRFWAFLFDIALLGLMLAVVDFAIRAAFQVSAIAFVFSLLRGGTTNALGGGLALSAILLGMLVSILASLILSQVFGWLYYALLESSVKQATPGKILLGLHVTDSAGGHITFGRASLRHFMKFVALLPAVLSLVLLMLLPQDGLGRLVFLSILSTPLFFLISYGMAGWTSKKQSLHDLIAGCYATRVKQLGGGDLFLRVVGILVFFFVAKAMVSGQNLTHDVDQMSAQQSENAVLEAERQKASADRQQLAYPQLHVIGVGRGIPADGIEDPVWWKKCELESLDPASTECHQKYASVEEEGIVRVKVTRSGGPLILAFQASESTTWKLDIAEGVAVEKIILAGSAAQKIEGRPAQMPLAVYTRDPSPCDDCFRGDGYFYGYEEDGNLREAIHELMDITGKTPTSFQGRSQGDSFTIDETTPLLKPKNPFILE